jgi:L-fuconate dehydratase
MAKITGFETFDVRFPTSKMLDGSDAMNQDPDYSGAYLRINTDSGMHGDSLIFTIGRGNEVQIKALDILAEKVVGLNSNEALENIGDIARQLSGDSQLRWLGPDYGVFHMGAGGVLNALWDLFAKERKVPLWKLLSDLSPEQVVKAIDFRYIRDALNRTQALDILNRQLDYKNSNEAKLRTQGVLAYTTSPGWLGYTDEKMLKLTQEAMDQGFTLLKYKCGKSLEDDKRRLRKVRELVGPDFSIAIDANQVWDVDEAITWINELKEFKLRWIEEPTSPTDVVGHAKIAAGVAPTAVATGEMAGSRIIFKQLLQSKGFSVMQIDATRVAGVNENIANILMAAKYSVPVCPHAGGVGLCEMVQHLAMFDAVAVTGHHLGRIVEFVDHLHEHFVVPTDIQNGSYMAPLQPGAGAEMHQASIEKYQFPSGSYWKNGE